MKKLLYTFAAALSFSCAANTEPTPTPDPPRGDRLGTLFILDGQSNSAGLDENSSRTEQRLYTKTRIFDGVSFVPLNIGVNNYGDCPTPWPGQMFGAEWGIADRNELVGGDVRIIKFARYGAPFHPSIGGAYGTLSKGEAGSHYPAMVGYINAGLAALDRPAYRVIFVFTHGETDGTDAVSTDQYITRLRQFIADITADCNIADARVVIARVNSGCTYATYRDGIRSAQAAFVSESPGMRLLWDTDGYPMMPGDNAHYRQWQLGIDLYNYAW